MMLPRSFRGNLFLPESGMVFYELAILKPEVLQSHTMLSDFGTVN